jgi:hypothetical protein
MASSAWRMRGDLLQGQEFAALFAVFGQQLAFAGEYPQRQRGLVLGQVFDRRQILPCLAQPASHPPARRTSPGRVSPRPNFSLRASVDGGLRVVAVVLSFVLSFAPSFAPSFSLPCAVSWVSISVIPLLPGGPARARASIKEALCTATHLSL